MLNLLVIIDSLRQRLNRWALTRAAGWWGAVVLATMLGLFAVDALVRSSETSWRWLQFSSLVTASVWAARKYFLPLRVPPSRAAVARQIESQVPELRDRLLSAVLFLEEAQRSPTAQATVYDSPQLRERVVLETTAECADRDFSELLSPRSLRRALLACGSLAAVFLGLALVQPNLLGIGLLRQLAPWRDTQWPREHELYIEADNLRLARGETFHAAVLDHHGTLPRDLILQIRASATASPAENIREDLPLPWQPDRVAFRREDVQHDFEFRVIGGDDRVMPWMRVEVLEPARLEELTLQIIPPAHTRWPAYRAEAPLLVLPGSSLAITGRTTRPLKLASVDYAGQKIPLQVATNQRDFQVAASTTQALPLTTSGKLHFEFTDAQGVVSSSEGYEVRLVPDQTPTIEWGTRAAEELLTPNGKWSIIAAGRDDVAIERIELVVTAQDADSTKPADAPKVEPLVQELYQRPQGSMKQAALEPAELEALRRGRWPEERLPLKASWQFPTPPALGSRWQAVLRLTDSAGQTTESEPRTLKIVSAEELSARMANRWSELLRELVSLNEAQQNTQRQVIELLDQPAPNVARPDTWLPQQRQIARELTLPSAKIPRQLAVLEEEFAANQLQQTTSGRRLEAIQQKLATLRRKELAALEQRLNTWEQASNGEPTAELRQRFLQDVVPLQAAVQQRLREIIDQLDQQSNWAQLERTLQTIQQTQQTLRGESVRNENLALGRVWEQLTLSEQGILRGLAQQQAALAEQLSTWQNTLGKLRLDATSGTLVAEELRKLFLQRQPLELMRGASGNLAANRTGQATQQQAATIAVLAEALELLRTGKTGKPPASTNVKPLDPTNNKSTPPAEQLAELRKLQERLAEFEKQQATLNQQTIQFAALDPDQENPAKLTAEGLSKEQLTLHDQVMKLSTEQGNEGPLMFQLIRIAEPMEAAAKGLRQNDAGNLTQQEQRLALDRLRLLLMAFSSRDLPPPPKEANKQPNKENPQQAPKLKFTPRQVTELRLIRVLQLELTARTAAIADAAKSITEPTAAEQRAAAQIADEQEKLREMLEQLIRETAPATEGTNEKEN